MATVIKVNGMTISVGNNNNTASTESVVYSDVDSALIASTEAFVMANVKCAAAISLEGAFADMSTEAAEQAKPGVMQKIGGALKKAWDAVVQFFQKIIHYVTSFFQSAVFKVRASSILAKVEKNGGKFKDGWQKRQVKGFDKKLPEIKKAAEGFTKAMAKVQPYLDKAAVSDEPSTAEQAANVFIQADVKNEMALLSECLNEKDTTIGQMFTSDKILIDELKNLASGSTKELAQLKIANDQNKKMLKTAMAGAKKAGASPNGRKVKAFQEAIKLSNTGVKVHIKMVNVTLACGSAAIGVSAEEKQAAADKKALDKRNAAMEKENERHAAKVGKING